MVSRRPKGGKRSRAVPRASALLLSWAVHDGHQASAFVLTSGCSMSRQVVPRSHIPRPFSIISRAEALFHATRQRQPSAANNVIKMALTQVRPSMGILEKQHSQHSKITSDPKRLGKSRRRFRDDPVHETLPSETHTSTHDLTDTAWQWVAPDETVEGERMGFGLDYSTADLVCMYDEAVAADKHGDVQHSERLLKKLAIVNPTDGRVWSRLSRLAKAKGDMNAAAAVLHRALQVIPSNAHMWHSLAEVERAAGNFIGARALYRRAVELEPKLSRSWDAWGRMETSQFGDVAKAKDIFAAGLKHDSSNHRLWHAYGVACDRLAMPHEAARAFEAGLRIQPSNPFLMIAKAVMQLRQGDVNSARVLLNECLQVNAKSTEAWLALAELEESQGRIGVAREVYRQASASTGNAPQLWQSWARMEQLHGDTVAAADIYTQASHVLGKNAQLITKWAKLEADNGNASKAREILQRAVRIDPTAPGPYKTSAELEMDLGQFQRARVLLFKGAVSCANTAELGPLLITWAVCEWRLTNADRARLLFEWAARITPADSKSGYLWQAWARMELSENNMALAANYVSRAVLADSKDSEAWELWAELERRRGEHARAAEYTATAESLREAQLQSVQASHQANTQLSVSHKQHSKSKAQRNVWSSQLPHSHASASEQRDLGHPLKREWVNEKPIASLVERFSK